MHCKIKKRLVSLILVFCLLLSIPVDGQVLTAARAASGSYTSDQLAAKAVEFINDKFKSGEKIDGYTAYVLTLAGENLASQKWTRNNLSLKEEIRKSADLLGNQNSLVTYILATQNADGSFGPYANEYGTKAPLQALAMVKGDLPEGDISGRVQKAIDRAVEYFKDRYMSGSLAYDAQGFNFDYRCVEALADAGEDLSKWVHDGKSLKEIVITSADAAADNAAVLDAVYLAKELTALYAVEPQSDNIEILAQAIADKKNTDGDSIWFGDSIYDDVMVLTALGKAGKLDLIDQQKAFNYVEKFKHQHEDAWGNPAGAAWGGFEEKEPDLTAQVITALRYFDGARDTGSDVYNAIEAGLAYLKDIQDADTAAIKAQYDSTFATAETLIALKSLGKAYEDYAGAGSGWVKRSGTKTIAQHLLALNIMKDAARVEKLVNLLKERHSSSGFDNSVYTDFWAYIALGEAGKINAIKAEEAKSYILGKQSAKGPWGEKWGDAFYPDFMSTAQAIRALTYLPAASGDAEVQSAIEKGLAYLKKQLQPDGSVYITQPFPDDPVVDTAEVIVTLKKLGRDPREWKSSQGLTPVDYMMQKALNPDGSFGPVKNILDAAEALHAFILLEGETGSPGSGPGSPQPVPGEIECTVDIAVVGKDGELLFGPDSVTVSRDGRWGLTALGALDATGLDYECDGGFVKSIEGQANRGMNGWMYKVNGKIPSVAASEKAIRDGDEIIWWYSTDYNSSGPTWKDLMDKSAVPEQEGVIPEDLEEQNERIPEALQVSQEALAELLELKENAQETIGIEEIDKAVVLTGNSGPFKRGEFLNLKEKLLQNKVDLKKETAASIGAAIVDSKEEVALLVPAGALKKDLEISIKESDGTIPPGFKALSGIYEIAPEGTSLSMPATLAIRVAVSPLVKPENLVLARYDKAGGRWTVIPAVVDMAKGVIIARIEHFSKVAVFAKEVRKSFADVSDTSFGWAKDAVEALAGSGIVTGVDGTRFEPGRAVTRAEFVTMIVKALGLEPKTGEKRQFKDVEEGSWYEKAVYAALDSGLVNGYEDGTFRPDGSITREELAVILARAGGLAPSGENPDFKDGKSISPWSRDGVAAAVAGGLINGFEDGTFRPKAAASRAQAAVVIYRFLGE
ncbi:S-layer homology domain-containing protein [Thermosediminibacter litoriperuensis]|uniref:Prenyltransferase/squalene oxidase-like repeat protein n=1 Tax=Thermosediminibacter litoriperuensis TaxID=291989 RepID=A0A5S5AQ92_9FIRM|nr:S-layer homology domain-containing protein [Thermosediminibacter litoriperuensis]TYP54201.1 prenyltransferase/squalene oxidase-like repeat protein [Thermosediminibacter litoriperuensis]